MYEKKEKNNEVDYKKKTRKLWKWQELVVTFLISAE